MLEADFSSKFDETLRQDVLGFNLRKEKHVWKPSLEDIVLGGLPGIPKVHFHNPFLAYRSAVLIDGDQSLAKPLYPSTGFRIDDASRKSPVVTQLPLNFEKILNNLTVIENIVDIVFLSGNGSIYPIADESP